MRDDLNKVLCERPRPGSSDNFSYHRNAREFDRDYSDDEPFYGVGSGYRESMKFRYRGEGKPFNEFLTPLWRLLHKHVGKNWDKVYSKLCSVFDMRSSLNQHIVTHLFERVERNVVEIDGKLYAPPYYSNGYVPLKESQVEFYIDPRDHVLKLNNRTSRRSQIIQREKERIRKLEQTRRIISEDEELHLLGDTWFLITFETYHGHRRTRDYSLKDRVVRHTSVEYPIKWDVLKQATVSCSKVAVRKQTACHRLLKQYGMTN